MSTHDNTPLPDYQLSRNAFGRLVLKTASGEKHEGVTPVRAFPIDAPEEGISLVSVEGHELTWIDRLTDLAAEAQELVRAELARREFMPVVSRLAGVSTFATPSIWNVDTNRGATTFILRGEEDIRRIGQGKLLITDSHGIQYLIPDLYALDSHSRKLLDRFL
jgi:hypothetical protein